MSEVTDKGNDPTEWDKLLTSLDEKLQLGLLEHLRRARSYHFEDERLFIEPSNRSDQEYLSKATVLSQLRLLAEEACGVKDVVIQQLAA